MDVFWPRDLLVPKRIDFWPESTSRSGGRSLVGSETLVTSASVRWRASLSFVFSTRSADRVLTWRAVQSRLYGRARPMIIGPFDIVGPSALDRVDRSDMSTFGDGAVFFDGAEFAQPSRIGTLAADAALRDTVVTIAPVGDWTPMAGQYFSPESGRMHMITALWSVPDGWSCEITPPLRRDYDAHQQLDFSGPTCRMRLSADDGMRLAIDVSTLAEQTVELEEIV